MTSVSMVPPTTPSPPSAPMPGESNEKSTDQERRLYDPVSLAPLHPLTRAQRIHRHVRNLKLNSDADDDCQELELPECRSLIALQPLSRRPNTTSPSGYNLPAAYVFDGVLTENPKTGVTMLVAHPMMPEDPANSTTCCLVSCGTQPVVIKAVPHPSAARRHVADDAMMEIASMECLMQHARTTTSTGSSRVIELLDCMEDEDFIYLVLPYMRNGDLFSLVESSDGDGGLPETQACHYIRQIAEGLLFMKRSCNMAHRDVSLENVMLNPNGDICIIDLGTALVVPERDGDDQQEGPVLLKRRRCCGKGSYVAPEVVRQEPLDFFAADIWSLGVCLYTLLVGRPLYNSSQDQAFTIMAKGGVADVISIYEGYGMKLPSPSALDLVCRMLDADPTKRPTLEQVLNHPYLAAATASGKARPSLSAAMKSKGFKYMQCSYQKLCPWGQVLKNNAGNHIKDLLLAVQ